MRMYNICGLIISAGLSKRMGRLKPLIDMNSTPFLVHIIQKLNRICNNLIIVTGHQSDLVKNEITGWLKKNDKDLIPAITWCYNRDFESGMLTSLQKGLMEILLSDWVLYHFVDQPHIPQEFYSLFLKQIKPDLDWIQPAYKSQKGHPVLLSKKLIPRILELDPGQSLRDITKDRNLRCKIWACDFPEILSDFDTPQQLKTLMEN